MAIGGNRYESVAERNGIDVVQFQLDWLSERVLRIWRVRIAPQAPVIPFYWTKASSSLGRGEISSKVAKSYLAVLRTQSVGTTMEIAKIEKGQPNGIS